MAQLNKAIYEQIARNFNAARSAMMGTDSYINSAVEEVVNITTTNYIPAGETSANASAAVAVEIALLGVINSTYSAVSDLVSTTSPYLATVRVINKFVIDNAEGTGTADEKLTAYVNSINWTGSLDDVSDTDSGTNEIPFYWEQLSKDAGYNTDSWRTEADPLA
jgi:hypothetical protein